jgi:type I restriction enzyme R subunit
MSRDVQRNVSDEAELRVLWSDPGTRKKLLEGLAEKGFGGEQLAEMQKIIDAEKSDLFDVLAHVAYALPPETREERAARAQVAVHAEFTGKQQAFLGFVLAHYVREGVQELDQEKLAPLLRLRYHDSIADAIADLGDAKLIGHIFAGFQKYLYQTEAAA